MYFPMLYGKKHELYAVRDLTESFLRSGNVIPVLFPVRANALSVNPYQTIVESGLPIIVVANPHLGDFATNTELLYTRYLENHLSKTNITLALYVDEKTKVEEYRRFMSELKQFQKACIFKAENRRVADSIRAEDGIRYCFHFSKRTSEHWGGETLNILVEDPFRLQPSNALYPEEDAEIYSNLIDCYRDQFDGFGDYTIVGNHMSKGGGGAKAVAIHFTYYMDKNPKGIMIRHFLSERRDERGDPQGKYLEALEKLVTFFDSEGVVPETLGMRRFRDDYITEHPSTLGYVKQYSIMHHMELISNKLTVMTATRM